MPKLYDIRAVTGEYLKDGETKKKYSTIGALIETKSGAKMIKLDVLPKSWDEVYLNEPQDDREKPMPKSAVMDKELASDDIRDEPFSLDEIPF